MSVKSFIKGFLWFTKAVRTKQVPRAEIEKVIIEEITSKGEVTSNDILERFEDTPVDFDTLKHKENFVSIARLYEVLMRLEEENKIKCEKKFDLRSGKDRYFYSMK